jgi:hypothetical protein
MATAAYTAAPHRSAYRISTTSEDANDQSRSRSLSCCSGFVRLTGACGVQSGASDQNLWLNGRRGVIDDRDKLRAKAEHYRKLARQMTDQRMVDVLEELASEYEQAAEGQRDSGPASAWDEGPASSKNELRTCSLLGRVANLIQMRMPAEQDKA